MNNSQTLSPTLPQNPQPAFPASTPAISPAPTPNNPSPTPTPTPTTPSPHILPYELVDPTSAAAIERLHLLDDPDLLDLAARLQLPIEVVISVLESPRVTALREALDRQTAARAKREVQRVALQVAKVISNLANDQEPSQEKRRRVGTLNSAIRQLNATIAATSPPTPTPAHQPTPKKPVPTPTPTPAPTPIQPAIQPNTHTQPTPQAISNANFLKEARAFRQEAQNLHDQIKDLANMKAAQAPN